MDSKNSDTNKSKVIYEPHMNPTLVSYLNVGLVVKSENFQVLQLSIPVVSSAKLLAKM